MEQIARKGAYPILQLQFEQLGGPFAREAPVEVLREPAPLQRRDLGEVDGVISIYCPENAHEGSDLSDERLAALAADDRAAARAHDGAGDPVGDRRVARRRRCADEAGHDARRVRGVHLRRRAARLGRRRRAHAPDRRPVRRGRRGAHRGGRHRPDAVARRPGRVGRRRARQHAGRRGVLLPARGLGERRDRVLRVPGRLLRDARSKARGSCSRDGRVVDASATRERGLPAPDARHRRRRAPARRARDRLQPGHPALHEERRLRREDRRHVHLALGNSYSFTGGTNASSRSTGTSSRTSARRAASTSTAGSCRRTAAGWMSRPRATRRSRRRAARSRRSGRGSRRACGRRSRGAGRRARTASPPGRARPGARPPRAPARSAARRRRGSRPAAGRAAARRRRAASARAATAAASAALSTRADTGGPPCAA